MKEIDFLSDYVIPISTQIVIAITALYVVRKQIVNSGITQFRQQWIDNLRNTLSEFYSGVKNIMLLWGQYDKHNPETQNLYKILEEKVCKIKLLSNPLEDDHDEMLILVEKISGQLNTKDYSQTKVYEDLENLVVISQKILKREWEVVKKGK